MEEKIKGLAAMVTSIAYKPNDENNLKKLYEIKDHEVMDPALRKDKKIVKQVHQPDGTIKEEPGKAKVNRIPAPYQKYIVKQRVAFANVGRTVLSANTVTETDSELLETVKMYRDEAKIAFKEKELCRILLSEMHVARLWYSVGEGKSLRLKFQILAESKGDQLLPVFDSTGDLLYFGRQYKHEEVSYKPSDYVDGIGAKKEVVRLDIYDTMNIHRYIQSGNGWELSEIIAHNYGKIPVMYYSIKHLPWEDVQPAISRKETLNSNYGDTIDYNGSPIVAFSGDVVGSLDKDERGKAVVLKQGGKVEYITWDQAPDAIKLEHDELDDIIFTMTNTVKMSMKEMQGLGSLTGVAFDRVFMAPQMEARDFVDGEYGEVTQRDINFVKHVAIKWNSRLAASANLNITFDIPPFKINDEREQVETLMIANGGKPLVTHRASIELLGWEADAEEAVKEIEEQTSPVGLEEEV